MTLRLDEPIGLEQHLEYPPRLAKILKDGIYLGMSPTWRDHYRLGDYLRGGEQGPFVRLWQLTAIDTERGEATIVSRTARFRAAETTAAFLGEQFDPNNYRSIVDVFRDLGGAVINPGGMAAEDRERHPTLIGQIHSDRSMIWFQRADDPEHRDAALILAYRAVAYPPSEEYPPGTHTVDPVRLATTEWWPLLEVSAAMIHSAITGIPDPLADRAWTATA